MKRNMVFLAVMAGFVSVGVINLGAIDSWPPVIFAPVPTGSMHPHIEPGDIISVDRAVHFHDVRVGDVAVYWLDGNRVTHRVIEITDTELITKGDANLFADEPVVVEQFIGVVDGVYSIEILNWLLARMPLDVLLTYPNNIVLILIVAVSISPVAWKLVRGNRSLRHPHKA